MTTFPSQEVIITGCNDCPFNVAGWNYAANGDMVHRNRCHNPLALKYKLYDRVINTPFVPKWCPMKDVQSLQFTLKK